VSPGSPSTVRFPGAAEPAVEPLRWQAWTASGASIRFPGAARVADEPLPWADWTGGSRAEPAAVERPSSEPSRTVPPAVPPPTELLTALARTQTATAQVHQLFLEQQQAHLDVVAQASRALTALLDAAGRDPSR